MNRWWQLLIAALAGAAVTLAVSMLIGDGDRIAVVNPQRILDESKAAQRYEEELANKAKEYEAELEKLSNTQERQAKWNEYSQELTSLKQEYANKVMAEADEILAQLAKRRGVSVVLTTSVARYGGLDLTNDVLKEMK